METDVPAKKPDVPASGPDLLTLYTHQYGLADASLAVERDITVKNYMAFGAVLLVQAGFFTTTLKSHVVITACGVVIFCISLAARCMAIFYGKYSSRLYAIAAICRKAYLRGRDGLSILEKVENKRKANELPDAEHLSLKEFLTYRGAIATINTLPALIGVALASFGGFNWYHDVAPTILLRSEAPTVQNTYLSLFPAYKQQLHINTETSQPKGIASK